MTKLNTRINEALNEVLLMSEETIEQLIVRIVEDYLGILYKISEAVSLLDMVKHPI